MLIINTNAIKKWKSPIKVSKRIYERNVISFCIKKWLFLDFKIISECDYQKIKLFSFLINIINIKLNWPKLTLIINKMTVLKLVKIS